MNDMLVTDPIMLDATTRLAVRYDTYPMMPECDGFGMFPVRQNSHYVTLPAGFDPDTWGALRDVFDTRYEVADDDTYAELEAVLAKRGVVWRRVMFTDHRDWVGEYYVWAHYPDATADWVNEFVKEVQAFCNGEVYEIAVETLHVYRDENDPERTIERWEADEAVCGVYLDSFDPAEIKGVIGV